jgi:hypothetical protein
MFCQGRDSCSGLLICPSIAFLQKSSSKGTNNGADMEKYSVLLKPAANEISRLFKKRNLQSLTNNRNAQIASKEKQAEEPNQFELVTWLVIK